MYIYIYTHNVCVSCYSKKSILNSKPHASRGLAIRYLPNHAVLTCISIHTNLANSRVKRHASYATYVSPSPSLETILYYTILYYTILYYTILYYTILCYAMLYY